MVCIMGGIKHLTKVGEGPLMCNESITKVISVQTEKIDILEDGMEWRGEKVYQGLQ